jgi:hypothetical protein
MLWPVSVTLRSVAVPATGSYSAENVLPPLPKLLRVSAAQNSSLPLGSTVPAAGTIGSLTGADHFASAAWAFAACSMASETADFCGGGAASPSDEPPPQEVSSKANAASQKTPPILRTILSSCAAIENARVFRLTDSVLSVMPMKNKGSRADRKPAAILNTYVLIIPSMRQNSSTKSYYFYCECSQFETVNMKDFAVSRFIRPVVARKSDGIGLDRREVGIPLVPTSRTWSRRPGIRAAQWLGICRR